MVLIGLYIVMTCFILYLVNKGNTKVLDMVGVTNILVVLGGIVYMIAT